MAKEWMAGEGEELYRGRTEGEEDRGFVMR